MIHATIFILIPADLATHIPVSPRVSHHFLSLAYIMVTPGEGVIVGEKGVMVGGTSYMSSCEGVLLTRQLERERVTLHNCCGS